MVNPGLPFVDQPTAAGAAYHTTENTMQTDLIIALGYLGDDDAEMVRAYLDANSLHHAQDSGLDEVLRTLRWEGRTGPLVDRMAHAVLEYRYAVQGGDTLSIDTARTIELCRRTMRELDARAALCRDVADKIHSAVGGAR